MYDPCGWKTYHDGGADADLALQVQGATVQFNERLGQRQAETGALKLAVQIGVDLLDKQDPSRVIARLDEPILIPEGQERDGYVPNVTYSCGAMIHNDQLIIPYAMSDSVAGIATLSLPELMTQLSRSRIRP